MPEYKYTALDVADEIMHLANEENYNVSQLKLIKICYFVYAWHLAFFDTPIFEEKIEAWMHGPVVPSVYKEFRVYGGRGISYKPEPTKFDNEEKKFIKSVWDVYKKYGAFTLRDMTHEDGSPWCQTYDSTFHNKINDAVIKEFYKKKLD